MSQTGYYIDNLSHLGLIEFDLFSPLKMKVLPFVSILFPILDWKWLRVSLVMEYKIFVHNSKEILPHKSGEMR